MENENTEKYKEVEKLLNSEFLTEPTRRALQERLHKNGSNVFFDAKSFELLSVICDLLMDQDSEDRMVNIALFIDERLVNKEADGWRYDSMPADGVAYRLGLQGIDETALLMFGENFIITEKEQQMQVLSAIQNGEVENGVWKTLHPELFFEDLLAETAEIFYSHPLVQVSINYVGMADAKGWTKIKLNESENLEK